MSTIGSFLEELGVGVNAMSRQEAFEFDRRWLRIFASAVFARHVTWVYRGYRWHGFSFQLQLCRTGHKAYADYTSQWPSRYVVFDEQLSEAYRCESEDYPDLSPLWNDVYVAHENLKWTMAFTHEQPDLGPFFATRQG